MAVEVEALLMTGNGAFTVIVNVAVPEPVAFVAVNVTGKLPVTVGVPEIAPVVALMVNPVGRPVCVKLVGELVAVVA